MAVAADAKTATVTNVNAAATLTISNLTIGGSANAVEAMIWFATATFPTGVTATWNGVSMTQVAGTQIADGGSSTSGAKYALLAPATGSHSLVFNWTGNQEAHAEAQSYTGVDQTSVAVAFPNGNTAVGVTALATITINSAVGNIASAFHNQGAGAYGAISGTTIAKDDTTGPAIGVVGNFAAGASPNVTLTAAGPSSSAWASFGSDIKAATGGAAVTIGWSRPNDPERPLPRAYATDVKQAFISTFVTAKTPTNWIKFSRDDPERLFPLKQQPDSPSFFKTPIAVNTISGIAWYDFGTDDVKPQPIKLPPDEAKPFFRPSQNPVPQRWLPISGSVDRERLPPIQRTDWPMSWLPQASATVLATFMAQTSGEDGYQAARIKGDYKQPFVPLFITAKTPSTWVKYARDDPERSRAIWQADDKLTLVLRQLTTPVGISGIAWWNPPDTRLPPILGDPYAIQTLPPFIEPPLQPFLAQTNADDFSPLAKFKFDEQVRGFVPRQTAQPVGISGIAWWRPSDDARLVLGRGTRQPDDFCQWFVSAPAPVGISGMAWWRPADDTRLPPLRRPPDEPDTYYRSRSSFLAIWLPQWESGERIKPIWYEDRPTAYAFRVPAPPVGISGMAWFNPSGPDGKAYPGITDQRWSPAWMSLPANLLIGTGVTPPPDFQGSLRWNLERAGWPKRRRKPTLLEILADVIEEDPPPPKAAKRTARQKARARAQAQRWAEEIVDRAQREAKSYELDFAKTTIDAALKEHAASLIEAAIQRRLDREEDEAILLLLSHYY